MDQGSDQDFVFPNEWAEVKAVSISSTEVTISSLQQLDREDDGLLIIYFMDKTTSSGKQTISLNEVIGEIRAKTFDLRLRNVFDCKLAKYGFLDKDAESYKEYRYRLVEKHTFSVGHSFPRLTRKNIPVAITNAKYGINLAIIDSFRSRRVDTMDVRDFHKDFLEEIKATAATEGDGSNSAFVNIASSYLVNAEVLSDFTPSFYLGNGKNNRKIRVDGYVLDEFDLRLI